ncbi:MAG: sulfite exporter TauE/SafE family protein [Campylobacterales bacterium]|nr:sulfite exporter TauE/SafE family protein [Campylobacterales bacterium]
MKALFWGAIIGVLGGLMGLGGAEFRLPVLILLFGLIALDAVVVNLLISLVTVCAALWFRFESVDLLLPYIGIVATLLCGSLAGAFYGATLSTRIEAHKFDRLVAILLALIALVIVAGHSQASAPLSQSLLIQSFLGVLAGVVIGIFSSMLGIAGGELIIPTLMLLYGIDIKTAGTLSLLISLPTVSVGLWRYYKKRSFKSVALNSELIVWMAIGSILGAGLGRLLLEAVDLEVLRYILALILAASSLKLYKQSMQLHQKGA